jgi:hypothetical protein
VVANANSVILLLSSVPAAAIPAGPEPILKRSMEGGATGRPMAGLATDGASRNRVHRSFFLKAAMKSQGNSIFLGWRR